MTSRFRTAVPILVTAVFLSACTDPGRLAPLPGEVGPAPGGFAEGVDGLQVGHRLMAAGEYESALKAYNLAAVEQGLTVDTISAIGSANLRLGRLGQAERILRSALEKDDRFIPAWNNLGVTLDLRGKFGEAREAFRVAFLLDSGLTPDIAENLRRMDAKIANEIPASAGDDDFRLVRRGNGRYLLLGETE